MGPKDVRKLIEVAVINPDVAEPLVRGLVKEAIETAERVNVRGKLNITPEEIDKMTKITTDTLPELSQRYIDEKLV